MDNHGCDWTSLNSLFKSIVETKPEAYPKWKLPNLEDCEFLRKTEKKNTVEGGSHRSLKGELTLNSVYLQKSKANFFRADD